MSLDEKETNKFYKIVLKLFFIKIARWNIFSITITYSKFMLRLLNNYL